MIYKVDYGTVGMSAGAGEQQVSLSVGTNNIDCGFIPSKILLALMIGGVAYYCFFDKDVSTTQFHLYHNYGLSPTDAGMVTMTSGAMISNWGTLSNGKQGFAVDIDSPSYTSGIANVCYLAT